MTSLATAPLVWLDFNEMWDRNHVALRVDDRSDLARQHVEADEGLWLRGYDLDENPDGTRDNLVCEGTVTKWAGRDRYHGTWVIELNYLKHESDLADQPDHWCHSVDWDEEERIRTEWVKATPG